MPWLDKTFADALAWASTTHGDREALVEVRSGRRLTFAGLHAEARAFARGLIGLGVARGEHVALWMSDSIDWMIARWAVPMIGAVLVPINTRFRDADLRYVLAQSDTVTLILEEASPSGVRYLDLLARVVPDAASQTAGRWDAPAFPALRRVIGRGATLPASIDAFERVLDAGRTPRADDPLAARIAQLRGDDVAQILYTSGTTSFPKGAMVCHGPLLQNNLATVERMGLGTDDRYLSCVPLFSATGTSYTLSMLLAGAAVVIADRFEPREFCSIVERERITVGFFIDTIVQDLRAFTARGDYDLSTLRTGTGAPLSRDAFLFASDALGVRELIGVFGMSETSNAVARGDCRDPLALRAATNGRAVPGVELRIADLETNATLPADTMGEICVRGFNVMRGYYKLPDEDAKAFDADGWLHSGDLGTLDADGYLVFRGRVKEMIKPGGFNVSTQEIEAFLRTHPGVREAVVVGVPDLRLGEVAFAYVERAEGATVTADDLVAYARAHIAGFKVPRHVEFVTDWPRTSSQKIRKLALKERARAQRVASTATIDVAALHALIGSGAPFALFDVRDPGEAERGHVFGSTILPRRRIEAQLERLVIDRATPIVVVDDASGRAPLAAATMRSLGYADVRALDGGVAAWQRAGHRLATGTNVPSKWFGERVHHDSHVPSIDVATFRRWQAEGRDVVVCDVRTPGEYARATIPGSFSAPSFDLVLGLGELRAHEHVVVHCAGRTRSIIGTQTLRDLGLTHAVALENGTMGWTLAGHALERGATRTLPLSPAADDLAPRARALAASHDVRRIGVDRVAAMLDDRSTNRAVFDVRGSAAFDAGHVPGSRSLPGGQAIQRTDDFVAVRAAPIVLLDGGDGRAELTAVWLRRMGFSDVAVVDGGVPAWIAAGRTLATGKASRRVHESTKDATVQPLDADTAAALIDADGDAVVIDVDTSLHFNAGHVPGALWLPRGWLELRIRAVAPSLATPILVTCVDGVQARLATATLRALGHARAEALAGGTRAWAASRRPLETAALPPQDDIALAPYEKGREAMRAYLAWETALVAPDSDPARPR